MKLLDILYISDFIMHGYDTEDRPETKQYRHFIQWIFSYTKDFGVDAMRSIYTNEKSASDFQQIIDKYSKEIETNGIKRLRIVESNK